MDEWVGQLVDARLGWVNGCLKVLEELWLVVGFIVYWDVYLILLIKYYP